MCALLLLHTAQSSEFLEFLHGCQPSLQMVYVRLIF